jgi:hypothetical protein
VKDQITKTIELGELVLAVFDEAAQHSTDPREISRLATQAVSSLLWHMPQPGRARPSRTYNCPPRIYN